MVVHSFSGLNPNARRDARHAHNSIHKLQPMHHDSRFPPPHDKMCVCGALQTAQAALIPCIIDSRDRRVSFCTSIDTGLDGCDRSSISSPPYRPALVGPPFSSVFVRNKSGSFLQ